MVSYCNYSDVEKYSSNKILTDIDFARDHHSKDVFLHKFDCQHLHFHEFKGFLCLFILYITLSPLELSFFTY